MRYVTSSILVCSLFFLSVSLSGCSTPSCADLGQQLNQARSQASAAKEKFEKTADQKYSTQMTNAQQSADKIQSKMQDMACKK